MRKMDGSAFTQTSIDRTVRSVDFAYDTNNDIVKP